MRKKSSYSEENFLTLNSAKVSEYFRQNPRMPRKMKLVKTKYPSPTIRTVGQMNSPVKNTFLTAPFEFPSMSGGDPGRKTTEHNDPWSRLHQTFSNSQSPRNFPHGGEFPLNEPTRFCCITDEKEEHDMEPQDPTSINHPKTSESGVQVNMFHCKECRRHIKYGKTFKLENSCTESDSENQLAPTGCTNCERREDIINLTIVNDNREEDEKSENEEHLLQRHLSACSHVCSSRSSPREFNTSTPRFDNLSKNGDEMPGDCDLGTQVTTFSETKGGKQFWLPNTKLITVAIVIIPLILHLTQQTFSTTLPKFNFQLSILAQEEPQVEASVVDWFYDFVFGVQPRAKPLPLFLYFF